ARRARVVRPRQGPVATNICCSGRHELDDSADRLVCDLRDLAGVVAGYLMVLSISSPCYGAPGAAGARTGHSDTSGPRPIIGFTLLQKYCNTREDDKDWGKGIFDQPRERDPGLTMPFEFGIDCRH